MGFRLVIYLDLIDFPFSRFPDDCLCFSEIRALKNVIQINMAQKMRSTEKWQYYFMQPIFSYLTYLPRRVYYSNNNGPVQKNGSVWNTRWTEFPFPTYKIPDHITILNTKLNENVLKKNVSGGEGAHCYKSLKMYPWQFWNTVTLRTFLAKSLIL